MQLCVLGQKEPCKRSRCSWSWPRRETCGIPWTSFCWLCWPAWMSGEDKLCLRSSPRRCQRSPSGTVWRDQNFEENQDFETRISDINTKTPFYDAKFLIAMLTFFLQFLDFWYWNKDTSNLPNYPIPTLTLSFQDQIFCHWRLTLRLFSKAIFKPILKPSKIGKSFNIERYKKPRCHTLLSGLGSERCWWRKS